MLIKRIKTYINGNELVFNVPNKKSIVLRGSNGLQVIYVLESLLSGDTGHYNFDLDKQYGFNYQQLGVMHEVQFNDGIITGMDRVVHTSGRIPRVHVIRYLSGVVFRSFLMADGSDAVSISQDMMHYSKAVPEALWQRIFIVTNRLLGFQYVARGNEGLEFRVSDDCGWSQEAQCLAYILIAECCLTPEGYHRVLLLPDIKCMTGKQQASLIETLDNIQGHSLCLSCGTITYDDLASDSCLSFVSV